MEGRDAELTLRRLADAFLTAFQWLAARRGAGRIPDPGGEWAAILASGIDGVLLAGGTAPDQSEPHLPFVERHRISANCFEVLRGGMKGGPPIDVLLQVHLDTEEVLSGFGVPIMMREVPHHGPIPRPTWDELHGAAAHLDRVTPSARVVLMAQDGRFDWGEDAILRFHPFLVVSAGWLASQRAPPRPRSGRIVEHFAHDLASGWIGDHALGGHAPSPVLDEVLRTFPIRHLLRISVQRDVSVRARG